LEIIHMYIYEEHVYKDFRHSLSMSSLEPLHVMQ